MMSEEEEFFQNSETVSMGNKQPLKKKTHTLLQNLLKGNRGIFFVLNLKKLVNFSVALPSLSAAPLHSPRLFLLLMKLLLP